MSTWNDVLNWRALRKLVVCQVEQQDFQDKLDEEKQAASRVSYKSTDSYDRLEWATSLHGGSNEKVFRNCSAP